MTRLAGTGALVRLGLRRDRILLPAWMLLFPIMTVSSASATMALYPDAASRTMAASAVNNVPVAVALYGRIWDPTSLGALSLLKLAAIGTVMVSILAIILVTRHARAEEDKGRIELLRAGPVGPWAPLASSLVITTIALTGIGILSAVGLTAVGLPATGSWAFGLAWITTGLVFAGVSAVANQVMSSARGANALAMIVLAIAYVARAIGDAVGSAQSPALLSWLSPVGWAQQVRPYAGDRLAVLVLSTLGAGALMAVAFALDSRRDLGAGLLPDRPGAPDAARWLGSPLALALRLQFPLLIGWLAAYLIFGAIMGSIINDLGDMMDTPQARQLMAALGGTDVLLDAFIAMEFAIIAFITASYGIAAVHRLASEELDGRAEPLLATSVSRTSFLASHLIVALVGATVLTVGQGLAFAVAQALQSGDGSRIGPTLGAALAYLPAVWLMSAVVIALFGFAPRLTVGAWILLVAFLLVSELGALLDWPAWVMDASPFGHVPQLPVEPMQWTPLIVLLAIGLLLVVTGAERYRRRDLATP